MRTGILAAFFFQALLASFHGPLKTIDKQALRIEAENHEVLTFYRTHKTRFTKGGKKIDPMEIEPGTPVTVDVEKGPRGSFLAVNVTVDK